MAEETIQSTGTTPTTTETTTVPVVGLETGKSQNDGLASALGDGTGAKAPPTGTGDAQDKPAGDGKDAKPSPAPEKYEAWKVPEGYELDAGLVEEASPIFKKLGLNQDQTQELVDFYSKHALKTSEANNEAFWNLRKEWRDGMIKDEALGKLVDKSGKHGPDSPLVVTINRALDGLQNPKLVADFKDAMELTGAGDNPAFVRILHALASKVTEGTTYAVGGPTKGNSSRPTAGAALYPSLPSSQG